jgi:hypothetical protein
MVEKYAAAPRKRRSISQVSSEGRGQARDESCQSALQREKRASLAGKFKNATAFSEDVGGCFHEYDGGPERCHSPYPLDDP